MKNQTFFSLLMMLLLASNIASGEGLFDTAVSGSSETEESSINTEEKSKVLNPGLNIGSHSSLSPVSFGGSIKGQFSSTLNTEDESYITENSSAELRGKITTKPSSNIRGFSEIIMKNSSDGTETELREAYIDIYTDHFDLSIGEKIISWGKADAVNPTNKITPYKMGVVSSNEDDRRSGNFLFEAEYNVYPLKFTAIWIPVYRATELPTFIKTSVSTHDAEIINSSFALKTDFESSSFDFSISYLNGYNPMPGISGISSGIIQLKPYRIHNFGIDFSTTVYDYGLRAEAAYMLPFDDYDKIYVPSPELAYIAGIDRSIGVFTVILQYSGKLITDFKDGDELGFTPSEAQAEQMSRMITSQTDRITHTVIFRGQMNLFNETLSAEAAGSYNFTTEEIFIKPLLIWDAADSLELSAGSLFYAGPENSLFDMFEEKGKAVFAEVKLSF